jgi:large subunit ribosomal protein L14
MAIQKQSYLKIADNSGAKEAQCIHIVGPTRTRYARVGDVIVVAIKKAIPGGMVAKGDVKKAVIVRTRKESSCAGGGYIRFGDNAAIIIKDDITLKEMIGTRVFGPVARKLKDLGFAQIASLAPEVL